MKISFLSLLLCLFSLGWQPEVSAQKALSGKSLFGSLRARQIGPAVMSGRVSDLEAVESNPKVLYIGSAGGGLWKSNSAGASFISIFDDHCQSIGKICIDQQRPDTVWVGTGETWVRNSVSMGDGIYLTTNGGTTWEHRGLKETERISGIEIDPNNPNTVYAGAAGHLWGPNEERGVFKTTDGGKTWTKILYVDENTGCADLAMDPNDPNVLYAAMWEFRRKPYTFSSGGAGSGLYKSTDGGKSWNKIHQGFPEGDYGRIAIAVAPSNSKKIYITLECKEMDKKGLYVSDDAGANWKWVSNSFNTTVRPFYFSRMVVDPLDEDKIFKCGLNLVVSEDAGKSFRTVGSGVHSDIHAIWVSPKDPEMVYIGTDGGAYRSLDGGRLFEQFMNLPISQFYHVSVDMDEPYNVYGGLQDNGSWYAPSSKAGGITNSDWELSFFGDGFWSFRHPADKDVIYSEYQGGNLVRHYRSTGVSKSIKPVPLSGEKEYRFNWNAPIHLSPNNPEKLYFGSQFLLVTTDRGDSWQRISPDLSSNDPKRQNQAQSGGISIDNSSAENNTTIFTIAESSLDEQIIWAGTDDGNLQVTRDGGKNWTNVAPNIEGLPAFTWCSYVEAGHYNKEVAYVTFDNHRENDKNAYVYKTTDLGKTWTKLSNASIEGYAHCIREDLVSGEILYLGTEFGLYISLDGGNEWKHFENNVPRVSVRDMAVHPRDNALVLGTHGRGIIIIDDLAIIRQLNKETLSKKFHFFETKPAVLRYRSGGEPFGGAGNFIGQNPSEVATIAYFMAKRHTFGKMTVKVYDPNGKFIKELQAGKAAGINVVNMPLRLPMPKAAPTNSRMAIGMSIFGPALPEGTYTAEVIKGKDTMTTQFDLQANPKSPYAAKARKMQSDLTMKLYEMTERLGYIYYSLEKIGKKASKAKLADKANMMKDSLVSLGGDFYVNEGKDAIREEIGKLYGAISQFPGMPSEDQIKKTAEMEERMVKISKDFEAIVAEVDKLNRKAKTEKDKIVIDTFEVYRSQ